MRFKRLLSPITHASRALSTVGHYDFCPWANRYVYWLKHPLGWFVIAIGASAFIGLFIASQAWIVAAVLALVLLTGVAWPWISMRGITAAMSFDRSRCYEDESVIIRLSVTNRRPWPAWGLLLQGRLTTIPGDENEEITTALAHVPAWSKSQFEVVVDSQRRGEFPRSIPQIVTGFPFGLWSARRPVIVDRKLIVWPRCIELKSFPMAKGLQATSVGNLVDLPGHDGDVIAARAYQQGDTLRRVHWAHSARRDQLIVCERQRAATHQVLVSLDPYGPCLEGVEATEWWDASIRVVSSLCRELHHHSCEVTCQLNGDSIPVVTTNSGLRQLLDALAVYQPTPKADDKAYKSNLSRLNASLVIVVTSRSHFEQLAAGLNERDARMFRQQVRWVVLEDFVDSQPRVSKQSGVVRMPAAWIQLDPSRNSLNTLQKQWDKRCNDDWAVHY